MGIDFVKDERDKKIEGIRAERKRIAERPGTLESKNDELLTRLRDADRTHITNPDPNYSYRLANREKKGRVGYLKGMGYEVVPEGDKTRLTHGEELEGGQVDRDNILMRIPVEKHEIRRRAKREYLEGILYEKKETTKENINRIAREGGIAGPHKDVAFDESGDY